MQQVGVGQSSFMRRRPFAALAAFLMVLSVVVLGPVDEARAANETVDFTIAASSVAEDVGGGTVDVGLTLSNDATPLTADVVVDITVTGGTATPGADFTLDTTTVTFQTGVDSNGAELFATLSILADTLVEGDETVELTLNVTSGGANGTQTTHTLTITDGDAATVSFSNATDTVVETDTDAAYAVSVALATGGATLDVPVVVDLGDAPGTAANPGDYVPVAPQQITFPIGTSDTTDTSQTVTIVGDDVHEGDEDFVLDLTVASGPATVGTNTSTITITDDDPAEVSFAAATSNPSEAVGTHTVGVTLTVPGGGTLVGAVVVDVSDTPNTATTPADYTLTTAQLTWNIGDTGSTKNASVTIDDDAVVEGDEDFDLGIAIGSGPGVLGTTTSHTVTIADNEPAPTVAFLAATSNPGEDDLTDHTVLVQLTVPGGGSIGSAVTVDVADVGSGTASSGTDYIFTSPTTVTFNAGAIDGESQAVTIAQQSDTLVEGDETIDLTLQNATGGASISGITDHQVTISDGESPGTVFFSTASSGVTEATASHTVAVELALLPGETLGGPLTVDVTDALSGTATSGSDYAIVGTQTLTFPAGSADGATQNATLSPTDDPNVELDEDIDLILDNVVGQGTLGLAAHEVILSSEDVATIGFVVGASATADESAVAHVVDVELGLPLGGSLETAVSVVVSDAGSGSATAVTDYSTSGLGSVSFVAGSVDGASQSVSVTPVQDSDVEGDETVVLSVGSPSAEAAVGTASHTVTITDDDSASITIGDVTASEADGTIDFVVSLTPAAAFTVTVDFATVNGTAAAPGDFTAIAGQTVTFLAGSTSEIVSVTLVDDDVDEATETFSGSLANPSTGASIGDGTAIGTITDDDFTPVVTAATDTAIDEADTFSGTVATFTDGDDGGGHTATIDWGDSSPVEAGSVNQGLNVVSGSHAYADDGVYTVTVTVSDGANSDLDTFTVTVANVAPTIDVSGAVFADEGSSYSLTLGAVTDPGSDNVTTYTVNWGDGSSNDYTSAGIKTHTYLDGPSAPTITVDLVDEDGTHPNTGSHSLTVTNVAPTIALTGNSSVTEGSVYSLTLGAVTDPGTETIIDFTVDWGDGTTPDVYTTAGIKTHTYVDGPASPTITVDIEDEDGVFVDAGTKAITVNNVAPAVGVFPGDTFYLGGTYTSAGSFSDVGADDTHTATVDWDEGAGPQALSLVGQTFNLSHTYNTAGVYTVQVCVDDGTDAGCRTSTVNVLALPVVTFSNPTSSAGEGVGTHTVDVRLDAPPGGTLDEVQVTVIDDTTGTAGGSDYTYATQVLTFPSGSNTATQSVDVTILQDAIADPGETIDLSLSVTAGSADTGTTAHTVTIIDDDGSPQLTIGDDTTSETDADQTVTFTVNLSPVSGSNVTFDYTVAAGGSNPATAGDDFVAATGSKTILAGGSTTTIDVTVKGDNLDEVTETYTVTLTNASGATIADGVANGTILDDDATPIGVADNYSVAEGGTLNGTSVLDNDLDGDDGVGALTAALGTGPANATAFILNTDGTFTYTHDGSQTTSDGFTYTASDGSNTSGVTTVTISIGSVNDQPVVNAGADQNVDEGDTVNVNATFTDDDPGDSHTATIVWGDGDSGPGTVGAGTVTGSHVYGDNGAFIVIVCVTDDGVPPETGCDTLQVAVDNVAPAASIVGAPASSPEGVTINLTASVIDPGADDTFTYSWSVTKNGSPYGSPGTADSYSYTPDDNGIYVVTLDVSDDDGGAATTQTATTTVTNVDPSVSILGAPGSSPEGTSITLNSDVSDGGTADPLTYSWSVTKNGSPYGSAGSTASYSFTPDDNGTYVVTLTVNDDDGGSGTDTATITVTNVAPDAVINGAPATTPEGSDVVLTSGVTDPGSADTFTYAWSVTKNGNPFDAATTEDFTFTPDDDGIYQVTLLVTDDDGGSDTASSGLIFGENVDPTVTIDGAPTSSPEGTAINLTSTVTDPGSADTFTYAWSVTKNGAPFTPDTPANGASLTFTPDDDGTYVVTLTVTDDDDGEGTDTATVTVTNVDPVANITGSPGTSPEGTEISLTSSVTDPGTGDIFTYAWAAKEQGATGPPPFTGTGSTFAFTPPDDGTWNVTLTVTDDNGGVSAEDTETITITNVPPTIALTGAATVAEGATYTLTLGAITDPGDDTVIAWIVNWGDGNTQSYTSGDLPDVTHTYVNGPTTPTIGVSLTDEDGTHAGAGTVDVTVNNAAPVVADLSGNSQTINEGDTVSGITVSFTDAGANDTHTATVDWDEGAGPVSLGTVTSAFTLPDHFFANNGVFSVEVCVTDNDGGTGCDSFQVTAQDLDLTVDPGADFAIDEGVLASVDVAFVDVDGFGTHSYTVDWGDGTGVQGPFGADPSPFTATHLYADSGVYDVEFTVDESDGADTGFGGVQITVNNVAPTIAVSGADDVDEGSPYTLTLGAITDPGDDTVTDWIVNWGDGTSNTYTAGGDVTHTYLDGSPKTITVDLIDEDGTHTGAATKTIEVNNVAPTVSDLNAPASSPEGTELTIAATVTDPGTADIPDHVYAWSVTKNGAPYATGSNTTFTFTPDDNGTYVVSLTVTDDEGGVSSPYSETITVTNVAPSAAIRGPGDSPPAAAGFEGTPISLTSKVTDPGSADTFTYAWTVTKDGAPFGGTTTTQNFTFTPNNEALYIVTLVVTDDDGGISPISHQISVANVNPTVTISGATTVEEGDTVSLTANATDPGPLDTFTYSWLVTLAGQTVQTGTAKTLTWTPDDQGVYFVSVVVSDGTGTGAKATLLNVTNATPVIGNISTDTTPDAGLPVTLTAPFTDASPADFHSATVDWGDGSVATATVIEAGGSGTATATHTYANAGTYVAQICVRDNAGAQACKNVTYNVRPSGVDLPPGGSFIDDNGNVHEANIEAIRAANITRGCNPPTNNRYCPSGNVTRGQMAAFLARALNLPPATRDYFKDDSTSIFQNDINRLAQAGITRGCNPPANDLYCPDATVTRGQMAAFLARALNLPGPDRDYFVDDETSIFENDINRIARAGISRGCNPPDNDRYCPTDLVKRDQMASFLARALGLTPIPPPPP